MCFSHDGKGIPEKSGASVLAIMMMWCVLRMAYTALRLDGDTTAREDFVLALALSTATPLLMHAFLRTPAFFVFAHASLLVEVAFLLDIVFSQLTGQPPRITGLRTLFLVTWTVAATGFTSYRRLQQK